MDYRLVLLTLALIAICDGMRHQSIAVKGKLLCGTAPARNVRVKLWEEDSDQLPLHRVLGMDARFLTVVLLMLAVVCSSIRDQSIAVKGKLLCGVNPAANYRIKLWDEDSGPDPDDLLDQGYTDAQGMFNLKGGTAELTTIDPVFKVYHDCDDGVKPGQRKVKFRLPSSYITEGKVPKKTFDIGILNLETIFPGEERELLTSRMRRNPKSFYEFNRNNGLINEWADIIDGL
ncbi:Transthyretin-like protein 46 [Toxocara canis]|uniref:Transthyretin-like protein 46 n=1 Tax=Toxocara canis TaxID=6265 RepID=A0A0B2W1X6_TOXCA|nr:Transthyretin-like protein 46 [Toxocara canis]